MYFPILAAIWIDGHACVLCIGKKSVSRVMKKIL